MSDISETEGYEDGEAYDLGIPEGNENIDSCFGEDLTFIGRMRNQVESLFIVDGAKPDPFSPGTPVFDENYRYLGMIVDLFGPVKNPLYIIKPKHTVEGGTCIYINSAMTNLDQIDESDCSESSEEGEIREE